ncbi:hypothetical protein LTR36_005693 [Oleoguttula mirabilis]|uniref:RING-type domain-containing protein n=1 Tax=Oleoguttula mirabilis TaxID=1507867 RepID=A0AAV9JDV7_9PEZI|nr:hypothetical protein LTR36_005693 [Oleoguttula mirabilis]
MEVASAIVADLKSLGPDAQVCHTCGNDFEHPTHTPLVLACCAKLMCRYCFINWCESKGPDRACCPHCRHSFFCNEHQKKQLTFLKFGTLGRTYSAWLRPNQKSDAFESFERKSADLDKHIADNNRVDIRVDTALLLRAWQHVVNGALLEGPSSTPLHHQPVRCAELSLLTAALPFILSDFEGVDFPTDVLFNKLHADFLGLLFRHFVKASMHRYLTYAEFAILSQQPTAEGLGLQPGFQEFVERTLSRTLQFVHVRACEDQTSCVGFHMHGEKQYYNMETRRDGIARDEQSLSDAKCALQ